MSPEEKETLKNELDKAIHPHVLVTMPAGYSGETSIIEPEKLKEVLQHIIDALPTDDL